VIGCTISSIDTGEWVVNYVYIDSFNIIPDQIRVEYDREINHIG